MQNHECWSDAGIADLVSALDKARSQVVDNKAHAETAFRAAIQRVNGFEPPR